MSCVMQLEEAVIKRDLLANLSKGIILKSSLLKIYFNRAGQMSDTYLIS